LIAEESCKNSATSRNQSVWYAVEVFGLFCEYVMPTISFLSSFRMFNQYISQLRKLAESFTEIRHDSVVEDISCKHISPHWKYSQLSYLTSHRLWAVLQTFVDKTT
jgi:hypothetical protein